jgi:hypothetical protein
MRSATVAFLLLLGCSSNSNEDSKARATDGGGGAIPEGDGGRASGGDESEGGGGVAGRGIGDGGKGDGGGSGGYPYTCGAPPDHGPTATVKFVLPGDYAATRASTATLCRNEICSTVELTSLDSREPPMGNGASLETRQVPEQGEEPDVTVRHVDEGFVLEAAWTMWNLSTIADGDTYSVRVTSAADRPLVVTQTATYDRHIQATDCDHPWAVAHFGTAEGELCCPRDAIGPASELYMGGVTRDGRCWETHDFWCTENFRVESVSGCELWKYDDTPACTPDAGSGGSPDAGHD